MRKRNPKQGLWNGYWYSMEGKQLRRLRKAEVAEAYRLWAKHKDIREAA